MHICQIDDHYYYSLQIPAILRMRSILSLENAGERCTCVQELYVSLSPLSVSVSLPNHDRFCADTLFVLMEVKSSLRCTASKSNLDNHVPEFTILRSRTQSLFFF